MCFFVLSFITEHCSSISLALLFDTKFVLLVIFNGCRNQAKGQPTKEWNGQECIYVLWDPVLQVCHDKPSIWEGQNKQPMIMWRESYPTHIGDIHSSSEDQCWENQHEDTSSNSYIKIERILMSAFTRKKWQCHQVFQHTDNPLVLFEALAANEHHEQYQMAECSPN